MAYRAAYLNTPNSPGIVLTLPEHASMSDDKLAEEALRAALEIGIINEKAQDPDEAFPALTRAEFDSYITIGEWVE